MARIHFPHVAETVDTPTLRSDATVGQLLYWVSGATGLLPESFSLRPHKSSSDEQAIFGNGLPLEYPLRHLPADIQGKIHLTAVTITTEPGFHCQHHSELAVEPGQHLACADCPGYFVPVKMTLHAGQEDTYAVPIPLT